MIFAIIIAHGQLVSIARLKNYHLHPSDLYLLTNLVNSSDAFKDVESWVPICLPRFDSEYVNRHFYSKKIEIQSFFFFF